jgi:hypothetical protein
VLALDRRPRLLNPLEDGVRSLELYVGRRDPDVRDRVICRSICDPGSRTWIPVDIRRRWRALEASAPARRCARAVLAPGPRAQFFCRVASVSASSILIPSGSTR